ncbi:MAG: cache domain-containing protein, partial [Schwartzia sp.]|nr:cache domain-containing protein [Schwartzia sp. (in: firmicutes)]
MKFGNMNIQRKILALLLGAGLLSFLVLGAASFYSIYELSADAGKIGRRMGEAAADFTEEFAIERAKQRISDISQEKAQRIEWDMRATIEDAEYIALSAGAILAHPERRAPIPLPDPRTTPIRPGEVYILYAPELQRRGISPRLAEEIGLMSNIAEDVAIMGRYYKNYHASVYLASADGYFICTDLDDFDGYIQFPEELLTAFDPRERPWFIAAENAKKPIATDVYLGVDDGLPSISFVAPYFDGERFAGVAGIGYSLDGLQEFIANKTLGAKSINFVLDSKGQIILSSEKEGVLAVASGHRDLRQTEEKSLALEAAAMARGLSDVAQVTVDGVEYYLAYAP